LSNAILHNLAKEEKVMKASHALVLAAALCMVSGCVGRTGKVGEPIAERYQEQIGQLKVGQSTPTDLQRVFHDHKVSLRESKFAMGHRVEVWEVFRGGDVDVAQFLLWGQIAHDKDQSLLFRFEDGRLVSQESLIHPDN
jgi:hypothetical protein